MLISSKNTLKALHLNEKKMNEFHLNEKNVYWEMLCFE